MTDNPDPSAHNPRRACIDYSECLINSWLIAIQTRESNVVEDAMATINNYLRSTPSQHESMVRFIGLVMVLARRCAASLPDPPDHEPGFWSITHKTSSIDDVAPSKRLAFRLMMPTETATRTRPPRC